MVTEGNLHRLQRIDAREVWKHEAHAFTPWLETHIAELNEAIGVEIELTGREEAVGAFAVDLYGTEVQTQRPAIIENQLEPTDHGHLGQLLTYAAGLRAGVVVWIAPQFRDEHREAVDWLNEISGEDVSFFGVQLEVLEINGQRAANFRLVATPNAWAKQQGLRRESVSVSPRMEAYREFFGRLLERFKQLRPSVTTASKTQPASWFMFSAGRTGVMFHWAFTRDRQFRTSLFVDTIDAEMNREILRTLGDDRDEISANLEMTVIWDVVEARRSQQIYVAAPFPVSIDSSREDLERLEEWAAESMARFVDEIRPRLARIPV